MLDRGMNLKQALDHVRTKRPIAQPNPGFMIQLKAFEKVIFGVLSEVPIIPEKETTPEEAIPDEIAAATTADEASKERKNSDSLCKEVTDGIE